MNKFKKKKITSTYCWPCAESAETKTKIERTPNVTRRTTFGRGIIIYNLTLFFDSYLFYSRISNVTACVKKNDLNSTGFLHIFGKFKKQETKSI